MDIFMTNLSLLLQVGWFLARENKKQVVGAKMFVIAGPIIVFGVASSVLVGILYFIGYRIF